jgi:hypothetical protein
MFGSMHDDTSDRWLRARTHRWVALLACALLFGSLAWAVDRDHVIAWLPPAGTVDGYKVYVGTQSNQYAQTLDLGFVAPDPDGEARATLRLDSATDFYIAMTAYNAAGESAHSNEIVVPKDACDPTACGDGNSCTADSCGVTGCAHTAIPDGTACDLNGSFGVCSGGACQAAQCAADAHCDDGNLCNGVESCVLGGSCASGTAPDCGTATACADPGCDPVVGCVMIPRPDGTLCGTGKLRGKGAQWKLGTCQAGSCIYPTK